MGAGQQPFSLIIPSKLSELECDLRSRSKILTLPASVYSVTIVVSLPGRDCSLAGFMIREPPLGPGQGWWDPEQCSQTRLHSGELGVPVVCRLGAWLCS